MRRIGVLVTLALIAGGATFAQSESEPARFEVSVEKGMPSVLSGPELDSIDNWVFRFGWAPTKDFQLTASYTKWEGELSKDGVFNESFAIEYNQQFEQADQRVFREAELDQRDFETEMFEFGLTKFIPLGSKHWESFIGIAIGLSYSTTDVTWTGAELRTGGPAVPVPSLHVEESNAFMTSVRGGVRWIPVRWFAVEVNAKLVPIASMFEENLNSLEVNGALVFRFGKFE
jgi:hypothetical protein